jgi:hypothetical protein
MLSCREVTTLHAADEIQHATWKTRMGVRLHLMMCRHCRRYVRELARIGAAVRALYAGVPDQARDEALLRRVIDSLREDASS